MSLVAQTINGRAMYDYIKNQITYYPDFALMVGGYAHEEGDRYDSDGFEYIVNKWWKYCDEIAEWYLGKNPEHAADLGILAKVTCEECYSDFDPREPDHDWDCSKA